MTWGKGRGNIIWGILLPFESCRVELSMMKSGGRGGSRIFFLGGGALVSCSTSTPINHIVFFFCRIPVVLENRRSS